MNSSQESGQADSSDSSGLGRNLWTPIATALGGVAIIAVNVLTLVAIKRTPSLHSPPHRYIASLAVADAMVGVSLFARSFKDMKETSWVFDNYRSVCLTYLASLFISLAASIVSIVFVSIDRCVCITYPLRYKSWMTDTVNGCCITFVWVFAVFYGCITYFANHFTPGLQCVSVIQLDKWYQEISHPTTYFSALLICCACYLQIWRVVLRQRRKRAAMLYPLSGYTNPIAVTLSEAPNQDSPMAEDGLDHGGQMGRRQDAVDDRAGICCPEIRASQWQSDDGRSPEGRFCGQKEDRWGLESKVGPDKPSKMAPAQRKGNQDMQSISKKSSKPRVTEHTEREARRGAKLAMTLAVIFLAFTICGMPMIFVSILAGKVPIPYTVITIATVMYTGSSGINFMIYAAFNKRYRAAFADILFGYCRRT